MHQIEGIHTAWKEGNARLETLQVEQLELSTVVSAHDAKLESGRSELRALEAQVEQLQEQLLRYSEANEKSEGYGEVLKERKRNLENNREQLMLTLGSVG
ncbi:Chromosome partition protein Smc [compost metagenome]